MSLSLSDISKPNRFLRTFNGHNKRAISYARFPFEQLEDFRIFIKNSTGYSIVTLDRFELQGLLCITNNYHHYLVLRRYNGEEYWNITNIASHVFPDFTDVEILDFFTNIKAFNDKNNIKINLTIPFHDFQYIEPTNDSTKLKYTNEKENRFGMTCTAHISQIEEIEKKWLADIS